LQQLLRGRINIELILEPWDQLVRLAASLKDRLSTLMVLPNAARGDLEDLQQSVTGLVQGVGQTNLRATQELVRLANPSPLVELQQRFVREYFDTVRRQRHPGPRHPPHRRADTRPDRGADRAAPASGSGRLPERGGVALTTLHCECDGWGFGPQPAMLRAQP
jgi:hypothetical protein